MLSQAALLVTSMFKIGLINSKPQQSRAPSGD